MISTERLEPGEFSVIEVRSSVVAVEGRRRGERAAEGCFGVSAHRAWNACHFGVTKLCTRIADVETMHAMTIHKSQGSQAAVVTVLMPPEDSRLLTRELLYTAVTRAKTKVGVVGVGGRSARGPGPSGEARQRAAAAPAVMAHVGLGCSGVSMIR